MSSASGNEPVEQLQSILVGAENVVEFLTGLAGLAAAADQQNCEQAGGYHVRYSGGGGLQSGLLERFEVRTHSENMILQGSSALEIARN